MDTNENLVTISFNGGKEFAVKVREHELVCDQPPAKGGRDRGPAPAEWLASALGSCVAFYVVSYLEARSLPMDGLDVQVSWDSVDKPKRIGRFRLGITLPNGVPEINNDRIRKAAERCMIHNTFHHPPAIDMEFRSRQ
jgi:uncharacterized OsmC-like protein